MTAAGLILNAIVTTPIASPSQPVDYSLFGRAGGLLLTGQWGSVFGSSLIQAGVLELAFWGVPFVLGVHGTVGWIVFGIVAGSLLAFAFAFVAERLIRPLTPVWSAPLAVGAAALAGLSGMISQTISAGHPSEVVVPLLWLVAAALARSGRSMAAAAALASSTGWELWGLLGVPVLLLAPRIDVRTIWRSAVGGIAVIAVLFGPFVLLGPFDMFSYQWTIRGNSLSHLLFPHRVLFPWPFRLVQAVLSVGAGAAVALLLRRSRDAIWLVPVAVCVVRLFTDPVLAAYYAAPPFLLLAVGIAFSVATRRFLVFALCLVMLNVLIDIPLSVVTVGILVVLTVLVTVIVVQRARRGGGLPENGTPQ